MNKQCDLHDANSKFSSAYLDDISLTQELCKDSNTDSSVSSESTYSKTNQSHEEENVNLINSGRKWFGEKFSSNTTKNFSFFIPDLIQSELVNIELAVASRSFQTSNFLVNINNSLITNLSMPIVSSQYAREYAKEIRKNYCLLGSKTFEPF